MKRHIKRQKILSLLLALMLIISAIPLSGINVLAAENGEFEYEILEDGTAQITGYNGTESEIVIPSEIDGYKVTGIKDYSFDSNANEITCINIPESVTDIGIYSFAFCDSLRNINVDSGNMSYSDIDGVLFNKEQTLLVRFPSGKYLDREPDDISEYTIPDGVTDIADGAFFNNFWDITISSSVTSIGKRAFEQSHMAIKVDSENPAYSAIDGVLFNKEKTELIRYPYEGGSNYIIPDGVTSIGDLAFYDCLFLEGITIPDGVTSIGNEAFGWCGSLTDIIIPDNVTIIGSKAFYECESLTYVEIPYGVTSIGSEAFEGCASLTGVTIPNSVTSIEDGMFRLCTSLADITIPYGITSIGKNDFDYCISLNDVSIPDSVTSIGDEAFCYCESLTEVTIPNSVTNIGKGAFSGCTSLSKISLSDSLTSIDDETFSWCNSLTNVTIPNSVTSIGDGAFSGCESLTNIMIPGSVSSIEDAFLYCTSLENIEVDSQNAAYSDVDGVLFNKAQTELIRYPIAKSGTVYNIPNSVTNIREVAFYDCISLTDITIPEGVTKIETAAFYNCGSLNNITIPDSITSIGGLAFCLCVSLTDIIIPSKVTSIGQDVFDNCTSLENIKVDSENTIYSDIDGVLFDKAQTKLIRYPEGKKDTDYNIPDGVSSIKEFAFYNCKLLTEITISDSVTSIGEWAFYNCTSLNSAIIPDSVTTLGYHAFGYLENHPISNFKIYGYEGTAAETYAYENGFEFTALNKAADESTGISVSEKELNIIPDGAQLKTEKLSAEENKIVFDISLTKDGSEVQPNGEVTVKIPVPEGMNTSLLKVYREEADGTLTDMKAYFVNGCMVFTTDHFSKYVLAYEESSTDLKGDVNGDGKVTAIDARWVLQIAAGIRQVTEEEKAAVDFNKDGKVTAIDARWVLQAAAGIRTL